ncbi:MAG: hypothetical protein ABWJ98_04665 [Hydrogenothermaceae bacterium]
MWKPTVQGKFVSNGEIFLFSFIVILIMILLFPKGKLEELVLEYKDSNVELANVYLENLVRINPDPQLKLLLAQRYFEIGNYKRSEEILEELEKSGLKSEVAFIRYQRLKFLYFLSKEQNQKLAYYKKMENLLTDIYQNEQRLDILEKVYKESVSMNMPYLSLKVAEKISKLKSNKDLKWLEIVYQKSLQVSDYKTAMEYLSILEELDKENYRHWLTEHYKLSLSTKDYKAALKDAIKIINLYSDENIKKDIVFLLSKDEYPDKTVNQLSELYPSQRIFLLESLAEVYKIKKEYNRAYTLYIQLFNSSKNFEERKKLFIEIVNLFLAKRDYSNVKQFISKYYREFIKDKEIAKFILKSALATGDPTFAYKIALDIKEELR